jgi:O-antigen ligase
MWYWVVQPGNYSRIVAICMLAGWALRGFGNWHFGQARGVVIAFLGFWGWTVISAFLAPEPRVAWSFVEEMTKILLPFLVGITMIDSVAKIKQLAWVILLTMGYVAYELNMSYYDGFNRLQEIGFRGMDGNCVSVAMNSCIGMGIFLALHEKSWVRKGIALICVVLMLHVVLFSYSRGGMLGLLATGLIGFFLIKKQPMHYLLFLAIVLVGWRLAGQGVQERFMTSFASKEERDGSAESRLKLWENCIDIMIANPVFGVGPDHFPVVAHHYGWPEGKAAHTLWLQTGAELGFPGLGFLILFYGLCMVRLFPLLWESSAVPDPWLHTTARMIIAALVGFMISAQFVSMVGLEIPYYICLIGAATLKLASVPQARPENGPVED